MKKAVGGHPAFWHNARMMTLLDIETLISTAIPDAQVTVNDPQNDGVHLAAMVVSASFEGKTKVARHRMVYAALGNAFAGPLHALQLATYTPAEYAALSR